MKQKGFSLVELMIVTAIIGVLVLIAQPFYADYVIRVNVAKAIAESHWIKTELEVIKAEGNLSSLNFHFQEDIDKYNNELTSILSFHGIKIENNNLIWVPDDSNHPIHHVEIWLAQGYKIYFNDFMLKAFKRRMGYEESDIKEITRKALAVTVMLSGHSWREDEQMGSTTSSYCGQDAYVEFGSIAKMYSGIPAEFLPHGCRGLSPYYTQYSSDVDMNMNGALKATELKAVLDFYWGPGTGAGEL